MQPKIGWQVAAWLLLPGWVVAQVPVEELPPPTQNSVLKEGPTASALPQPGWGLFGASGRFYFAGGWALADYVHGGKRQIVPLIEEDSASHAKPDSAFLYFREQDTGNRWAIRRQSAVDRRFSIYFQAADSPASWQLFQRALGSWDDLTPTKVTTNDAESACGCSQPSSETQFSLP